MHARTHTHARIASSLCPLCRLCPSAASAQGALPLCRSAALPLCRSAALLSPRAPAASGTPAGGGSAAPSALPLLLLLPLPPEGRFCQGAPLLPLLCLALRLQGTEGMAHYMDDYLSRSTSVSLSLSLSLCVCVCVCMQLCVTLLLCLQDGEEEGRTAAPGRPAAGHRTLHQRGRPGSSTSTASYPGLSFSLSLFLPLCPLCPLSPPAVDALFHCVAASLPRTETAGDGGDVSRPKCCLARFGGLAVPVPASR